MKLKKLHFAIISSILFFSSCITHPELVVFHKDQPLPANIPSDALTNIDEPQIQKGDVISITVTSFNPELAAPFNQSMQNVGGVNATGLMGYLVNTSGEIAFPVLGQLTVENLTVQQIQQLVIDSLISYIKSPTVTVRLLNFRVTVLGEVGNPGVFTLNSNRNTVLEALGLAGDLTPYSDRENILVIREINGVRQYGRINIQSLDIFKSPYYFLKQNDIIYVDPQKKKTADVRQPFQNYIAWVSTFLGTAALIVSLFR